MQGVDIEPIPGPATTYFYETTEAWCLLANTFSKVQIISRTPFGNLFTNTGGCLNDCEQSEQSELANSYLCKCTKYISSLSRPLQYDDSLSSMEMGFVTLNLTVTQLN